MKRCDAAKYMPGRAANAPIEAHQCSFAGKHEFDDLHFCTRHAVMVRRDRFITVIKEGRRQRILFEPDPAWS